MSAMGAMPMPGGWTMVLAWRRMPGQPRLGAAASCPGRWVVMRVARMLPSVLPMLAILLVIGVMNLRAMAVVAAVITVARLAPASERVARAIGGVVIGTGLLLIARAAGLG